MADATINGIRINYHHSGSGQRVLFLNGSGASLAGVAALLTPFAERFDLLAHDQRGLGLTEVPPGPYTMADYAADAAGLMDHVGWESSAVVGISFGGMVAQELAVTWPERVERLALLCTSPGGEVHASYPLHELAALSPEERAARQPLLMDTRFTPEWLASHESDRNLVELMVRGATGPVDAEQQRGQLGQLAARADHDVLDRLGRIDCPTLVASGRFDGIAPVPNGEAIVARVAGAELRTYEGGHLFVVQDPAALPDVLDFLDG